MRIDLYTKAVLTVIALLLAAIALEPVFPAHPVFAATNDYSYLSPQPNEREEFGTLFIDMRNGKAWECSLSACKLAGRFPFENTR